MTVGFVRATKAYLLPAVLSDVYQFRKAFLTADKVLGSIFSSLSANSGTTTAVSALCGDYHSVTIDCQGFQPRRYSTSCPWGLLSYIENAASSLGVRGTISETEVRPLVAYVTYCLFDCPLCILTTGTVRACVIFVELWLDRIGRHYYYYFLRRESFHVLYSEVVDHMFNRHNTLTEKNLVRPPSQFGLLAREG